MPGSWCLEPAVTTMAVVLEVMIAGIEVGADSPWILNSMSQMLFIYPAFLLLTKTIEVLGVSFSL